MVFQNPNQQLINQTVQSEVAFGPENLALPQPEIAARVEWCLDVTGMAGMRKAAVVTLSGGQKQRTAIAATLAMRPRILVLDEPLSDLDPVGAQEVLATLQRLAKDGGTGVVIVEHRVDEVAPWADRVALMDDGRVVLDQPPRTAWAERGPWLATGVGIPDTVRLAHAVPEAFGSALPLSVGEAAEAVRDTWFPAALAAAAAARRGTDRAGLRNGAAAASGPPAGTGLTVGLGKPSAGVVRFRGQPIRPGKVFEHAAQVALLLQAADDMLFETTVLKELEFGFRFRARPEDPVLDVPEAIEFFGFGGREEDSPWELSQGGRQRLALAALLVGAPGVLVLDEPTTGQDADHMRAFLRLLDRVRARTGITIVTVTHDIRGLASRAARVVLLGDGQVRADGPASQVFAMTGDLIRWGVLAPPLARLQSELLGPAAVDVLLDVDELASAALAHRPDAAHAGSPGAGALQP
jgi:energy-coupling factor transport system ATP-binding protein